MEQRLLITVLVMYVLWCLIMFGSTASTVIHQGSYVADHRAGSGFPGADAAPEATIPAQPTHTPEIAGAGNEN
ncbi:MAG TPA: hypothetical protein VFU74_21390 [Actinocrinis sp.]|nr:hypothetical protein [Actinocrinis sp.]